MAVNQAKSSEKKRRGKGKPFTKNNPETGEKDERINRKGRLIPKDVKELQAVIDEIFAEEISDASGQKMDKLRVAINRLLLNKSPVGPIHILDRRFGKVPDKVDVTSGGKEIKQADEQIIDRAISTLADAIRKTVSGESGK